ncbi:hypothetical protein E2C00_33025 [Streptomyces sp. WAC05374]|uniref:hypothetical protein n=1 Tax=Streptomyces sp. WAC05374 TaxID=2487420 RepID=UPI000F897AA4|nr:hypothetical protein [Streptomyces sp. WAC05374]RST16879.1 hypothetical protein EF905_11040 [Streptomyces sp. WAC05374]TDF36829.1 hypothetical protein E2B92_30675 [Streptomyces sp. WAC05374]TDF46295.1 hypothetical protein E2C02_32275 [Streptomyces sp. WAC05374]TDF46882.1 hypothetical protein E2C00_33025 [Streptomyces sp. WAC05374]
MTWDKTWGDRMLEDAPEGTPARSRSRPHRRNPPAAPEKKPDDLRIRTVMARMGAIESTPHLANLK